MDCSGGVPIFMKNLYFFTHSVFLFINQKASGLQDFFQKLYRRGPDLSTGFCGLHYVGSTRRRICSTQVETGRMSTATFSIFALKLS